MSGKKQVQKGGPRVRASVRDPGRARVHLCGLRACYWRPCSRLGPAARRRGWRLRGAVEASWEVARCLSAALSTFDTQLRPRGAARAVGCTRVGAGIPGGRGRPAGGVRFAACALLAPRDGGRSLRARGAPRGAAILASSLRTRGGLGGRPAGLGVRTSQVQGVTRAGPEGRGAETVGRVLAMALISPEVQGREVQGRMNVC